MFLHYLLKCVGDLRQGDALAHVQDKIGIRAINVSSVILPNLRLLVSVVELEALF